MRTTFKDFIDLFSMVKTNEELQDLIAKIIIDAAEDEKLQSEALDYINDKFDSNRNIEEDSDTILTRQILNAIHTSNQVRSCFK
jgi:hypothetical protein